MPITNLNPGSSTPTDLPYPIHRLNQPQMILWLMSEAVRRQMASALVQRPEYRGGIGMISPTLWLFAVVDPRGNVRDLVPPFKRYEMWQLSNQPETEECQCANFVELESMGRWGDTGKPGHHPLCQFDRTSHVVFDVAAKRANERIAEGKAPQERPDEWEKIRKEVASK